ncbi:hypothetical protein [Moraxella lacunata]|jgi:hypothetical protein
MAITAMILLSNNQSQFTHISYDMCTHKELSKIALKHGADYMTNHDFDMPALDVIGDKQIIQTIQDEFNQIQSTHSSSDNCHISNLKYHAKHINPKLTSHIPDDVDYISYAPPNIGQDKAVYCHYHFSEQIFTTPHAQSQCHFIYLDNDRLITEDISDLERLHLSLMYDTHQFYKPYSFVYKWHDNTHLRYGMTFATQVNNQRYGYDGIY